ncbi:MAG: ferric enterobactin receptor [Polaribacter sp.]|jgi:ferric enterobactin receptor
MNLSYKIYLSTIFLLFISLLANGQNSNRNAKGLFSKPVIKGNVIDSNNELPLEFATVTLMNAADSSVVTGGITDEKGSFLIESRPGNYIVKIEFISYKNQYRDNIKLGKNNPKADLGTISLSPDANLLNTVEVRAEKSQLNIALDKKVFNVGKDLANRGGSATDVLDNVPSVSVDIEGNIALRGSGNVRILINGKPSGLVSGNTNGLKSIPASSIDRIEVITNPSARYEAEGMSGIINIILRKEQQKGLNGSFDLTLGYPTQYGAAINMNYRRKNLNFFTNIGINQQEGPGGGYENREFTTGDTTEITRQERDHLRGGLTRNIRLGADYFINDKNILTTSFLWSVSDQNNITDLKYEDFINSINNPIGISRREDNEEEDEVELEYAMTYRKIFSKEGHELTTDLRYQDNSEIELSDYVQSYFNKEDLPSGQANDFQQSSNDEGERQTIFQMDYVHPFSKEKKFETGIRSSFRRIKNNYKVEELDLNEEWQALIGLTNEFSYNEDIYAAYASYGDKIGKFSYQGGLRMEYTDILTKSKETNEEIPKSYINFFPSVNLSYDLPKSNAIQLSYSRRIVRPRFRLLNPFSSFSDDRNLRVGNPDLDPEFTDSYELGHIKYWDKGSLASAIFYRYSTDVIDRIREVNENDGTTISRPQNLATRNEYGFEFVASYNPTKRIRINGDVNFLRSITDGSSQGQDFNADTYTMSGRIMTKLTILKSVDSQISYNYRAPRKTTQGTRNSIHSMDVALSKDVLKNNGTITFSIRDLFNSRKWIYTTELENLYADGEFQWRARSLVLTFNYRLNQKKQRGRGGRGRGGSGGGEGF